MAKKQLPSILNKRSTGLDNRYFSKKDTEINYMVICLVLYGFSTTAIANHTGLTYSQVQHRIRMYKLQGMRSMFRMGETKEAQLVKRLALRVSSTKREKDKEFYHSIRNSILDAFKISKAHK